MNNKWLAIILGALIVLYIFTKLGNKRSDTSFNPNIILVDTSAINKIFISPKSGDAFTMNKNGENWQLDLNNKIITADRSSITSFFGNILKLKADRVVTKNKERWSEYEVEGDNSTKIELFNNNDKQIGLIIGRFNFDQMTRSATSFIRLDDENEVYAIDGFASMSLSSDASAFRNKEIVNVNQQDLTGFVLNGPGGTKSLRFDGVNWITSTGIAPDTNLIKSYLGSVSNVSGQQFDDEFNAQNNPPDYQLIVEGNNMPAPVEVNCFRSQKEGQSFVLQSSVNPESYFSSDSTGIYSRIFGKLMEILP